MVNKDEYGFIMIHWRERY